MAVAVYAAPRAHHILPFSSRCNSPAHMEAKVDYNKAEFDMPPQQEPSPAPRMRRRRVRSSRRYLYYSAILCGLVLLTIPAIHDYYVRAQRSRPAVTEPTRSYDLVLSEAGFRENGGKAAIAGVVKNQSKKSYKSVVLTFRLRSITGSVLGNVTANVERLAPGATAPFSTEALPEGAARFGAPDIAGTPE